MVVYFDLSWQRTSREASARGKEEFEEAGGSCEAHSSIRRKNKRKGG